MTTPRSADLPADTNAEIAAVGPPAHVDVDDALSQYRAQVGSPTRAKNINFGTVLDDPVKAQVTAPIMLGHLEVSRKFSAEGDLLASIPSTIGQGIVDSAVDTWDHKGRATFETAAGLALGAGFCLLSKNPSPFIAAATTWAGRAFIGIAAVDLGSRFARPMSDVWENPGKLEQDKKVLGSNLGDAVFNYSLAIAGGVAGANLGEKYLATTKLGEVLQGFKETEVTAAHLGKLVNDPARAGDPLAKMAKAFSRRGATFDAGLDGGLDAGVDAKVSPTGGASAADGTSSAGGAPGADGAAGELPFKGSMRLKHMPDGSQIGSTADGSVMVMTRDGTALWFKNNRSLFGLRNKLDLAKVLHSGGDETDVLTGMYSPTTMRSYGRGSGGASATGAKPGDPHFIGKDPSLYFDGPPEGGAAPGSSKVLGAGAQARTTIDGTTFVTGAAGNISAVESGGNRVFLDSKGSWKMSMGDGSPLGSDLVGKDMDGANFKLGSIPDRLDAAKKGAEVGLTEIMLERGGDIGSSLIEHEVLIKTTKAATEEAH